MTCEGRRRLRARRLVWRCFAAGLLLFAVATGVALSKHPLPMTLVLAFGVGLLGTLALVLAPAALLKARTRLKMIA